MNDWALLILLFTSLLNALGGVLAWSAKLRWSKEFAAAKDETIKAKEAQIEALKTQIEILLELTPMKVREYFSSVKTQLEEFIDKLQQDLQEARAEIERKGIQIEQLHTEGQAQAEKVKQLESERAKLEAITTELETQSNRVLAEIKVGDILFSYEGTNPDVVADALLALQKGVGPVTPQGKTGEVCQISSIYMPNPSHKYNSCS